MYKKAKVHIYKHTYSTFPGVRLSHFSVYVYTYICVYVHIYTDVNAATSIAEREKPRLFGRVLV